MPHTKHYSLADPVVTHLDATIHTVTDPFIRSRYVGLVATAAVTVYELCVKDIFTRFGDRKHKVLGNFVAKHFDRINGRIRLADIKKVYLPRFGDKYVKRFAVRLSAAEDSILRTTGRSISTCYGNIVTWRHQFAHEGRIPSTVTYKEAVDSYNAGKEVIRVLAETMTR